MGRDEGWVWVCACVDGAVCYLQEEECMVRR